MIDAHVHFWDTGVLDYPWLSDHPDLQHSFLPGDYPGSAKFMVFVEANCLEHDTDEELDFVDDIAAHDERIRGRIAYVNMLNGYERIPTLDRLVTRGNVVGIRHNIQGHAAGFCLSPEFQQGVHDVAERNLTFDLCCTADQLGDVTELVNGCPGGRFVLDHCGKPDIRRDLLTPWAASIAKLAGYPNVACKISGLFTEARDDQRNVDGIRPYCDVVRACFGPRRIIYGSDWPVVSVAGGEPLWRSTMDAVSAGWAEQDRALFYEGNALQYYALDTR